MENINQITEISNRNLEKALQIIEELQIEEIWKASGSVCYLVGSVKTRLLVEHLDIDFHVYSNDFSITKSFKAISKICENPKITDVVYKNLMKAEDMCLEWHLSYEETPFRIWTIDIIHIMNESPYAGMIERVTGKINAVMTDKWRNAILKIKWESSRKNEKVIGIEVYQAVIDDGVETYDDFKTWEMNRKSTGISLWEPK